MVIYHGKKQQITLNKSKINDVFEICKVSAVNKNLLKLQHPLKNSPQTMLHLWCFHQHAVGNQPQLIPQQKNRSSIPKP